MYAQHDVDQAYVRGPCYRTLVSSVWASALLRNTRSRRLVDPLALREQPFVARAVAHPHYHIRPVPLVATARARRAFIFLQAVIASFKLGQRGAYSQKAVLRLVRADHLVHLSGSLLQQADLSLLPHHMALRFC